MKRIVLTLLGSFFLVTLVSNRAYAAPGMGDTSIFRAEFWVGPTFGLHEFKENVGAIQSDHTFLDAGGELGARLGFRTGAFAFGASVAAALVSVNGTRTSGSSKNTYELQYGQAIAGAFLGLTLNGAADGPELFAEYFPAAHVSIGTSDDKTANPFHKGDYMNGSGFGGGFSFGMKGARLGLTYRDLTYNDVSVARLASPTSTYTDLRLRSITVFGSQRF